MKEIFKSGAIKTFEVLVKPEDTASFESGNVHPVYATFALGRDAEWCCRLFVLDMKEADEEGIGTFLNIEHISPALVGSSVIFKAMLKSITGNNIICSYEAQVGGRMIAKGETGQKIMKKEKFEKLFREIKGITNDE
ncbi:MAG: hypothetical protein Q8M15_12070 [Bacteroidota bacterium]|nr:hypothetical protein [Bacteroidota bacterium]